MTAFWDKQAATFDEEPDHGLKDPAVRAAWAEILLPELPPAPADVVDLGCGTGSLSVLLADSGYHVRGLDLSPRMLAIAAAKAAGRVEFTLGDASDPPYPEASCDVVLVRHVLWALPDPDAAIARWVRLLRPGGRLALVEGHWFTGAGLTAAECSDLVLAHRHQAEVHVLDDPAPWGKPITDERYLLVSRT
ncbi:class I SAM-dependent methyltransferase [Actinokineospora globicatena]|uniref:SAM-dependent methyltransferase n=1 Tax=Actinokineospora globicatena TaxID=103729 RepID=A0A9W6QIZ4_9PSEU|nr:class I SAM-dependent methyltransferase [Actinokineospora globicatena]GLW90555.1 SAM-dependent methyltransferase [Actinokineospora globicatena]